MLPNYKKRGEEVNDEDDDEEIRNHAISSQTKTTSLL